MKIVYTLKVEKNEDEDEGRKTKDLNSIAAICFSIYIF